MSAGASGAAGAAGAAAAMVQAIKASGVIVRVEPADFLEVVARQEAPLVVCARAGFFHRLANIHCQYLTSYKGLAFYTRSRDHLTLPETAEVVLAQAIWVPGN
jgi:hypothetical protein